VAACPNFGVETGLRRTEALAIIGGGVGKPVCSRRAAVHKLWLATNISDRGVAAQGDALSPGRQGVELVFCENGMRRGPFTE
jgi:hypothetical protein